MTEEQLEKINKIKASLDFCRKDLKIAQALADRVRNNQTDVVSGVYLTRKQRLSVAVLDSCLCRVQRKNR